MKLFKQLLLLFSFSVLIISCAKEENHSSPVSEKEIKEVTIFHINDTHGSIDNFSKIKYLIDEEKKHTNVLFVCAGDTFSGNPIVDNYDEKGYPMIDLMNKTGVDVAVLGNHEFDYGEAALKNRINQSEFDWLCANINTENSSIDQPKAYTTINIDNVKVTVLGLIQTKKSNDRIIPSTHPWRVKNFNFLDYKDIISDYSNLKETENSDIYIALTHLGQNTDVSIARNYPFFDFIIGGHSHSTVDRKENSTYIYQSGSKLKNLGKIVISIDKDGVITSNYELIDLSNMTQYDETTQAVIDTYNDNPELNRVIGYAEDYHNGSQVGYFFTDALLYELNADLTFQNTGGIRSSLDQGDITVREIYSIDPFNNGSVTYNMTIGDIKYFLKDTKEGLYYAGLTIEQSGNTVVIKNENGDILSDDYSITVGIGDFLPAVYNNYFTTTPSIKEFTTAETIINYLNNNSAPINYTNYSNYFKYQ